MKPFLTAAALCLALPATAGVDEALAQHILPGFARFADETQALAAAARADCRANGLRPAYQASFDAWMVVGDLRLGPSETGALSVAFWPDSRGSTKRTLARMIDAQDPVARDPAAYAQVSIAARGFFALDMLLYDPAFAYDPGSYTCDLVTTITADLAAQAQVLDMDWQGFAATMRSAGAPGNPQFLTQDEAIRALYTQILSGLEFTAHRRLGAPLGSFDRPRPARAEARRSGRSLRNVTQATQAARDLAAALADWPLPATDAAADRVRRTAGRVSDPVFADIRDPQARLRAEIVQQAVGAVASAVQVEIGQRLGIGAGFNSQDGD